MLFALDILNLTFGSLGVVIGFFLPLLIHFIIVALIARRTKTDFLLLSFSKLFYFDLDGEKRTLVMFKKKFYLFKFYKGDCQFCSDKSRAFWLSCRGILYYFLLL